MGITKVELAALRKADTVCFDRYWRDGDEFSKIRAIKDAKRTEADPYAEEITVSIFVESTVRDYDASSSDRHTCFHMIHSPQYSEEWMTIVGLLKAGDDLVLRWTAGNSNGYLDEAGLHRDELALVVMRGKRRMVFRIATSVCKDNTARMVRRSEYSIV